MLQAQASERELIDQLLAALRSLPEAHVELERHGAPGHDAQFALDVTGKPIHALVKLSEIVYPRDVRQLVWQIRDLARQQFAGEAGSEPLAVLVAESISPGARELLRAERWQPLPAGTGNLVSGRWSDTTVFRPGAPAGRAYARRHPECRQRHRTADPDRHRLAGYDEKRLISDRQAVVKEFTG